MTIALGILAKDGVVLAADTQETFRGLFKVDQHKILAATSGTVEEPGPSFAVTGAGTAAHLDALNQELCDAFARQKFATLDSCEKSVKTIVSAFHREHIAPFASVADYPECSLVAASAISGNFALWSTEKSAVREVPYAAVGIGAAHATLMLSRLVRSADRLLPTGVLAAYVMFFVKQYVDGCGKDTQILLIEKSGLSYFIEVPRIERLERIFASYMEMESHSLRYILGMGQTYPAGGLKKRRANLRILRRDVLRVLHERLEMTDLERRRSMIPTWSTNRHPLPTKRSGSRSRRGRK